MVVNLCLIDSGYDTDAVYDFCSENSEWALPSKGSSTAMYVWPEGGAEPVSKAVVRTVFGIYHPDSQEGPLALLGLIERVRLSLWRQRLIGKQFRLDMKAGADYLIYDKQLPPFYAGEMLTTWSLPSVKLEVLYGKQGYSNIRSAGPESHSCEGRHYGPKE